ncbi:hypothetical protein EJ110_NYTH04392 [Nymphaea thermarum]|nr:hypothetical protein EJ110_NYTH04392 [Nymphaea thermarum]
MQYKAVAGAMKAWLPCAGSSLSQFARATAGPNLRRTSPGLPASEAQSVEKEEVGQESGRVPRPAKSEAESVEDQEVGEESGEEEDEAWRRAPPKDPGTVEEFLVGGVEETPIAPTPPLRSPSLKHTEASPPIGPSLQQKRSLHTIDRRVLDEAVCAGLDGSPPKGAAESNQEHDENGDEHPDTLLKQKPSPLSEIEFADTRFPISQALDSEVTKEPIEEVVGFTEEQLDTAEEALLRGQRLFDEAKSRGGDPDFPPSRVLRTLLESRKSMEAPN